MSSPTELDGKPAETFATAARRVPGEPGIWVLILGDMTVFAALCASYLIARGGQRAVFAQSQGALSRNLGAANTLILLTSSLLVVLATMALRDEQWRHVAPRLTAAGVAVGGCFVAVKAFEYHAKIATGISPGTNEFFMYYFVLTGFHLLHVLIGLGVLALLTALARKPALSQAQMNLFEGGACFWHMVDLLWLIIFPVIFLVR